MGKITASKNILIGVIILAAALSWSKTKPYAIILVAAWFLGVAITNWDSIKKLVP